MPVGGQRRRRREIGSPAADSSRALAAAGRRVGVERVLQPRPASPGAGAASSLSQATNSVSTLRAARRRARPRSRGWPAVRSTAGRDGWAASSVGGAVVGCVVHHQDPVRPGLRGDGVEARRDVLAAAPGHDDDRGAGRVVTGGHGGRPYSVPVPELVVLTEQLLAPVPGGTGRYTRELVAGHGRERPADLDRRRGDRDAPRPVGRRGARRGRAARAAAAPPRR